MPTEHGRCQVCGRWMPLTTRGRVWLHTQAPLYWRGVFLDDSRRCWGSYRPPQRLEVVPTAKTA